MDDIALDFDRIRLVVKRYAVLIRDGEGRHSVGAQDRIGHHDNLSEVGRVREKFRVSYH